MKCPHCLDSFHTQPDNKILGWDVEAHFTVHYESCPACNRYIIQISRQLPGGQTVRYFAWPKNKNRTPLPNEVDDLQVVEDYNESSLVLQDSPKASAALSRRCLQYILREKVNVTKGKLDAEIQEVLDSNLLPSDIAENLDAIRHIGNFAAHPTKSQSTGEIVPVEPNEAGWNLEVLEQLIDYCYVRPAISKKKREQLNAKLEDAGKPILKSALNNGDL